MSDKVKSKVADAAVQEKKLPGWALLLDLEFAAVDGMQVLYKAYEAAFKEAEIEFSEVLFARFAVEETAKVGVGGIFRYLKQPKNKVAKLAEKIEEAYSAAIASAQALPIIKPLVKAVTENDGAFAVVTSLPAEAAADLIKKTGLPESTLVSEVPLEGYGYRSSESWTLAGVGLQQFPRRMIACAGAGAAAREALSARMHLAAFYSPHTEFQDFSGADFVSSGVAKDAAAIVKFMETR